SSGVILSHGHPAHRRRHPYPTRRSSDLVVKASVKPEQYRAVYGPMFRLKVEGGEPASPLYDWRPQSTYIRRPPYWEGALAGSPPDRKSTRLNSSHVKISYAVFCLKKKKR